jgi:ABC-type nitrate/sulfonate/bicarbonate transport system substrate-binding protein
VRADSGIKTPADFKGRTVGFKSGLVPAELDGMLKSAGLTRDDVKLVSVGFDPREFIEKKVDVYPVFLSNEPDTIRRAGVPITVLDPRDFGVPTLGLTYLAHRDTLQRGDVAERFLRATLRAAKWIDAHRDEAIAITLKYAKGADATHQRYLLDTDLANARRADGMLGRGAPEDWQALADLLTTYKVLPRRVDAQQAIDFSIVNRLYDAGQIK